MTELSISTRPVETRALSGESLFVETEVRNTGSGQVGVRTLAEPSPYVYFVVPGEGNRELALRGARGMVEALGG